MFKWKTETKMYQEAGEKMSGIDHASLEQQESQIQWRKFLWITDAALQVGLLGSEEDWKDDVIRDFS